jgi:transaldolase
MNRSQKLFEEAGQSIWYDNIQRKLLKNGEMARMIEQGEIRGVTSNPTIFMNAITRSQDYDETLVPMARAGASAEEIFYQLAIEDIQATADLFQPLYAQTSGGDGYVSLEVSPYLANDAAGTLEEAKRLWKRVNRPNLMIKIPATASGLPAITDALAEGINVNVTLIFSRQRYAQVMDAHLAGLEKRLAQGLPIDRIASVASFFVSRVDTHIDPRLQAIVERRDPRAESAQVLLGKAAIANARLAYADFKAFITSERFQQLEARGAHPQRPLWASTSTKNPAYRDVIYVEELIGAHTVNTVPPQTLVAFLEHGVVRPGALEEGVEAARQMLADLENLGISMQAVTQQLEDEGVKSFSDAFTALLEAVEKRSQAAVVR